MRSLEFELNNHLRIWMQGAAALVQLSNMRPLDSVDTLINLELTIAIGGEVLVF